MKLTQISIAYFAIIMCCLLSAPVAKAQNLILNGDINATTANWTTSCVNVECYGFETTYGGPSATNHVAEIDDEACMHQDVCALPGASYVFSMDATRRTGGGPNPCISHIKIMGLDASSTVLATYVDMDYTRTNTVFALTPVTGIPTITVPATSGVAYLRVELTDNTPGYLTLGMIVDNISLVMTSSPFVATGGSVVTCQNSAVPFSVSGIGPAGLDYYWDFGSGATPATSTSATPSASWSTPGAKTVTVAIGNGVCFSDTLTYSVTVSPAVHLNIFDTTCPHSPYTWAGMVLDTTGVYHDTLVNPTGCDTIYSLFLYVRPTIINNIYHSMCQGDSFAFDGHIYTATGTYSDTFITARGCDSVSRFNLTVNPIPAPPATPIVSYCQYDAVPPLVVGGTNLTWYGPGVTAGFTTTPVVVTTTPGTIKYYITQTVLGCTSDSAILTIQVRPKPEPPVAHDTAVCQFSEVGPLRATGLSIKWYPDGATTVAMAAAPVPVTSVTGTFTWYATQTVNGCESNRAPVNARVVVLPDFDIRGEKNILCLGDTLFAAYNGPAYATNYFWEINNADTIVVGSFTQPNVGIKLNMPGRQVIALTVMGPEGLCSSRDTFKIYVDTAAVATISTPPHVCLGDTVGLNLGYHSLNADKYAWQIDGADIMTTTDLRITDRNNNTGGPFNVAWDSVGIHLVKVNVTSMGGCPSKDFYDTVMVMPLPDPTFNFLGKSGTLCLEDSILFKAKENNYEYHYQWSPANFFNNVNLPNTWGKVNTYMANVTLTVSTAMGCKASSNMQLNPQGCCTIFLPNAFTPGPGRSNNLFRPVDEGFHRFHEFRISNRWGQTVFQSANDNGSWDGTFNGVPQDADVYYYFLKYDCNGTTKVQKGDVTLIR